MENHDAFRGSSSEPLVTRRSKAFDREGEAISRPKSNETLDILSGWDLRVSQSRAGYRFSLDSLVLADFVTVKRAEKLVDLGAGNGIIALLLARLYPSATLQGLELQPAMVERARRNVEVNGLDKRVKILQGDVREIGERYASPAGCDVVVCNPPYRKPASGRISPNREKQIARHELTGNLSDFLRAAAYLLRPRGRMATIYSAERLVELLSTARQAGIEPKRLRMVHSFSDAEAVLVLVEGVKGGRSGVKVMPPLIIYRQGQEYSDEVAGIIGGATKSSVDAKS